ERGDGRIDPRHRRTVQEGISLGGGLFAGRQVARPWPRRRNGDRQGRLARPRFRQVARRPDAWPFERNYRSRLPAGRQAPGLDRARHRGAQLEYGVEEVGGRGREAARRAVQGLAARAQLVGGWEVARRRRHGRGGTNLEFRITQRGNPSISREAERSVTLTEVHADQELGVALRLLRPVHEQFHRFHRMHVGQHLAKHADALVFVRVQQQFFLPRAGTVHVDGGINALLDEPAIEVEFAVAGSLELLEDHLVHAAAGIDEGGGENGQAAAFLDVAGGAKEPLRLLHGVGIETAGEQLAAARRFRVVG